MKGWTSSELERHEHDDDFFGLSPYACPECGAHLASVEGEDRYICLNACHLGEDGARAFSEHMRRVMESRNSEG